MRILVVEDERRLLELLRDGLAEEGHSVLIAASGPEAVEIALSAPLDAILLDVMLPGFDGFEVTRRLRAKHNETPVLMLTARDSEKDIIRGLDFGADDYITKPFSFSQLLARLRAVTRRSSGHRSATLAFADLVMDCATHEVTRGGTHLNLTRTEFLLLQKLIQNAGKTVSRQSLINEVWGYDRDIENNTLDAFIRLLRQKVDDPRSPHLIQTVRGFGYALRDDSPREESEG